MQHTFDAASVRGVVFDFDGTLVNSLDVTFEAFNVGIVSQGEKPMSWEDLSRHFGTGEDRIFAAILGEERAPAAFAACRTHIIENMHGIHIHDGVLEMLDALHAHGIATSIFTGRSWPTTELILRHHGWLERFVTVVANDHISHPKPSPEGLLLALERMDLKPQEVLYVGDSPLDVLAARSVGSPSVAALWDERVDQAALRALGPTYLAQYPRDLLQILDS